MKLYTEEQMHSAMLLALGRHGIYIPNNHYQDLIDLLTPIELPSDEEIEQHAEENTAESNGTLEFERGFKRGAKWMRDKIQGGNK
jgi:hypothetical protein